MFSTPFSKLPILHVYFGLISYPDFSGGILRTLKPWKIFVLELIMLVLSILDKMMTRPLNTQILMTHSSSCMKIHSTSLSLEMIS